MLLPRAALALAVLLLESERTSAELFGHLPVIDPGKILGSIQKGTPQNLADAIAKQAPQDMAAAVLKAGNAIEQSSQEHVAGAAKAILGAGQVAETLAEASKEMSTSPSVTTAPAVIEPSKEVEQPDGGHDGKAAVDGAVQQVLNGTGLQNVKEVHKDSPNVNVFEKFAANLAHSITLPSPGKVKEALEGAHPAIAGAIKTASPAVDAVMKTDPEKVQRLIEDIAPKVVDSARKTNPGTIEKVLVEASDPAKVDFVLKTIDGAEWWGSHWRWALLASLCCTASLLAGCWQLSKASLGAPRPQSLLVDAEINSWMNARQNVRVQLTEDACFRQF